ncbi:HepT-like ribonuclease domain-containing protein [Lunatimonas salinarum]|uniref:HepT-like ribonuclease domain-containing protein n=1 Tax=Lunatimonas salinarum TaxID=1774590 RepID=UPI001AE0078E|nr:HepT-like ribonuclease domain-containing protein [Lunatimonas salinarum]
MDKPTPRERAEHVLEAIELIKEYVDGVDENTSLEDLKIQSAVQYQFLIIGEASRHTDDRILNKYEYDNPILYARRFP